MGRRAVSCLAAAAVAMAALPACGEAEEPEGGARPSAADGSAAGESPAAPEPGGADGGAGAGAGDAAAAGRGVALKPIGRFESPVYVTGAPGFPRLLFVVERAGTVRVLHRGRRLPRPFLDISGRVSLGGERGLLSIAFPPDYRRSGRLYVYYTDHEGDIRVDELRRRGPVRAARATRRGVIEIPHRANSNHNGGQLQFLGRHLYLATGDGGSAGDPPNNAQDLGSLLGKLLRIDPRPRRGRPYSIPRGNPFLGRPGRPEIFAYGLRNPYRFSFDRVRGKRPRIALADVGQDSFEELNYESLRSARGANFGWDAFEGFSRYHGPNSGTPDPGGTTKPIFAYPLGRGGSCSIIGGYVVRDRRLRALRGRYVYADLCEGELRSLVPGPRRARDDRKLGLSVPSPASFGEDTRGRLFVASLEGPVYLLKPR